MSSLLSPPLLICIGPTRYALNQATKVSVSREHLGCAYMRAHRVSVMISVLGISSAIVSVDVCSLCATVRTSVKKGSAEKWKECSQEIYSSWLRPQTYLYSRTHPELIRRPIPSSAQSV